MQHPPYTILPPTPPSTVSTPPCPVNCATEVTQACCVGETVGMPTNPAQHKPQLRAKTAQKNGGRKKKIKRCLFQLR